MRGTTETPSPDVNRGSGFFGAIIASAVLFRLAWWATSVAVIENEGAEYARLAENLFAGNGYVGLFDGHNVVFPPLYPFLIGLVGFVVRDLEVAGRLVSLVAGVGLVGVTVLLGRRLFGERAGVFAGILAAAHPVLVATSVTVFSESLSMFLTLLGVYAAVEGMRQRATRWAVLAGAALGLGYLVRPELLLFAGIVAVVGALRILVQERRWGPALRAGAVPVVVAVLLAAPYMVYLSLEAGRFQWEGKSAIIELLNARMRTGMTYAEASHGLGARIEPEPPPQEGIFLTADQRVLLRASRARLSDNVRELLAAAPSRARAAVREVWEAAFLGAPALLLLALVGFAGSGWWRTDWAGGLVLAGFGALQGTMFLVLEYHFARYFFPLAPVLIPWAAAGLDRLSALGARLLPGAPESRGRVLAATLAGVVVALAVSAAAYPAARHVHELRETRDLSVKQAGRWIRETARRDGGPARPYLMGFSNAVAFYADAASYSLLPYAEPDRALAYIHRKAPDFIALRSSEWSWAPYTRAWLAEGIPDPCAAPAFETRTSGGVHLRVWRWTCRP